MGHLAIPEQRQKLTQLPFINQFPLQSAHEHAGLLAVAVALDIHPTAIAFSGGNLLRPADQAPVIQRRFPVAEGLFQACDAAQGGADEQVKGQGLLETVVVFES